MFAATKAQLPDDFQEIRALERSIAENTKKLKLMEDAFDASQQAAARANELVHTSQAALQSAEDNAAICSTRVLAQREEFRRNLLQAGFPDEASFKNAQRSPGEIRALETEIESFDRGISAAIDRLYRAKVNAENLRDRISQNSRVQQTRRGPHLKQPSKRKPLWPQSFNK